MFSNKMYPFPYRKNESAKLRALRAHVPTCLACLRVQVPKSFVLTYSLVNVFCVLACQRALCAYVPACLACISVHAPTCLACLSAHVI